MIVVSVIGLLERDGTFRKRWQHVEQGYSTSVASGPNKKITGGVRAAQNIDQIMAKNEKQQCIFPQVNSHTRRCVGIVWQKCCEQASL